MRGVAMQRKDAAIDHRIATQAIGGAPTESLAIILPGQCPTKWFWPLVMALVGAVDLRSNRELLAPSSRHIEVDHPPFLDPSNRIDPKIHFVSGKVTPQKWTRHLRLEYLRCLPATRKVEVPIRMFNVVDTRRQPVVMLPVEPEVEDPDRRVLSICPDRQDGVAQQ